jgi:hypothetical protein
MSDIFRVIICSYCLLLISCTDDPATSADLSPSNVNTPPPYQEEHYQDTTLSERVLYDKVLGSLVGSAIGDAMGAPTEMWSRGDISDEYGHVNRLDLVLREPSPEGPWNYNLPPGAGTDDTRWKELTVRYLLAEHDESRGGPLQPSARRFADFISDSYRGSVEDLRATTGMEPEPLEDAMRRLTWLQEWARVTRAYAADDLDGYRNALSRFYGGEMSCAGMLYAPALGAAYPGRPERAYAAAYDLALFDQGYARDITGLTAAFTAAAFDPAADSLLFRRVMQETDPAGFFRSRLLGRVAYQQYRQARGIVREANRLSVEDVRNMKLRLPPGYPYDSLTYGRTTRTYQLLAEARQDVPFHAGEVHLINLTAMLFADYQFGPAMEFIVNYGRDNDTVAAVTGAILGALHGFNALPEANREMVLRVNREVLDIDLEARARALTEAILSRRPPVS